MSKTITSLLSAAFVAALLVPAIAADKPMNMDMKKCSVSKSTAKHHHKARHVQKAKVMQNAKPGDRSQSTLERGVGTSAGKATKFTKRTLTVPQKNPEARAKPADRSKSTLERGVTTSAHKAGKFLKKTFTPPANAKK